MDVLELHETAYGLLLAGLAGGSHREVVERVKALVAEVPAEEVARLLLVVVVETGTRHLSQGHRGVEQARFEMARQRLADARAAKAAGPLADVVPLTPRAAGERGRRRG